MEFDINAYSGPILDQAGNLRDAGHDCGDAEDHEVLCCGACDCQDGRDCPLLNHQD